MTIPIGFAQVSVNFGGLACPSGATTTFGVFHDGNGTPSGLANIVKATWEADMLIPFATTLTLDSIAVKYGPDETGPSAEVSSGAVGVDSGVAVAPNTSVLVSKITGLGGRKGRGRMYLPGISENAVDEGGNLSTAKINSIQTELDEFLLGMSNASRPVYLLHADATAPTLVTSLECQSLVATQRRRLRR